MKDKLNLRKKLSSKKGSFKAFLYDHIAIIVATCLISSTIVFIVNHIMKK